MKPPSLRPGPPSFVAFVNVHNEIAIESNRNLPNRADKFADECHRAPTVTVAFTFALAARRSLLRAWRGFLVVSPARYRLSATTRIAWHATRRTRTHFLANAVLDEELQVVSRGLRGDLRT